VLRKSPFIIPSAPVLAKAPPVGREWVHEVKFDGWRAQLHKAGADVVIYTRNGNDVTRRFRGIAAAMATKLQASSAIIDAELVACDASGAPNFYALMGGAKHGCCAWCFDLLEFNGRVLTAAPLDERRYLLRKLLKRAPDELRFSNDFKDPVTLLKACEKHGLEGIVSKLREDQYRSGPNHGWIKVKTATWRAANRER
jgi:bifunctional non-homologous end joining protein LigD